MQQLIIQIADKEKAQMLLKLISALDFVNSVEVIEDNTNISDDKQDFFPWQESGKIEILLLSPFVKKHGDKKRNDFM